MYAIAARNHTPILVNKPRINQKDIKSIRLESRSGHVIYDLFVRDRYDLMQHFTLEVSSDESSSSFVLFDLDLLISFSQSGISLALFITAKTRGILRQI